MPSSNGSADRPICRPRGSIRCSIAKGVLGAGLSADSRGHMREIPRHPDTGAVLIEGNWNPDPPNIGGGMDRVLADLRRCA